ncbi:MAG: LysM domain-containing protein [Gammaproteobacteria bacterium]|nr:MAG: LysM domain-containing protein [Gammaproteobacteria bacterium]
MKVWAKTIAVAWMLATVCAMAVELRADHPNVYVVKKGDTLWDISAKFLKKPWLWPEIWQANPQVSNPHLIYPGDVLALVYIDGKPRLIRKSRVVKLSPKARVVGRGDAIAPLPLETIRPFLVGARVVDKETLEKAPYMVSSDGDHLMAGNDVRIYARGFSTDQLVERTNFSIFRPGGEYRDPDTGEILGYEAIHVGTAQLKRIGDPATLDITEATREALNGDRLLPVDESHLQPEFFPRAPDKLITGKIISVYDGVTQIGQYHVVIINRGQREGVMPGHVFTIWTQGAKVRDKVAIERRRQEEGYNVFKEIGEQITGGDERDWVKLPDEQAGQLMVFRVFDKVSLALVMEATRPIHVYDVIKTPE